MTMAHRDLASADIWERSLERSRYRRALTPKARREIARRKRVSAALATAMVTGPAAPLAAAQLLGGTKAAVASESPANRAIEVREGGLPLTIGAQGDLVAQVQSALGMALFHRVQCDVEVGGRLPLGAQSGWQHVPGHLAGY